MVILKIDTDSTSSNQWLLNQIGDLDHYGENGFVFIPNVIDLHVGENETLIFKVKKTTYYMPLIFTNGFSVNKQGV